MAEIKHLFHISAPREKVYQSLATVSGLAGWWAKETSGNADVGGVIEFHFGPVFMNKMKVRHLKNGEIVNWECVEGPTDWIGTRINFALDENEGKTRIRFEHSGFKETDDHFAQCNFSWGRYMVSLRELCEKGKGSPF